MRPELAALVVHDLKNALGALEAELELLAAGSRSLAAGLPPPPADTERARRSHRQCAELRQRFVQFLALYAADSRMTAHCSDESPRELLAAVAAGSQDSLPQGLSLVLTDSADGEPAFWYFDRRLVRMALDAALHNAGRFARSRIELGARSEAGYLVFSVLDDGPGLGADDNSAEAAASTGLGTALCESVAQAHGTPARPGRLTLANRPEGGARFELWLG